MSQNQKSILLNDKVINERVRLLILTSLAGSQDLSLTFSQLKNQLDLSSGNLSIHIKTLKKSKYITVTKEFVDNKPCTTAKISHLGLDALKKYLQDMERIIKNLSSEK